MNAIDYRYDPELVLAIPDAPLAAEELTRWARGEAERLAAARRLDAAQTDRLVDALARERTALAARTGAAFVAVDPVTGAFAPVRLGVLERAMSPEETWRFLRPTSPIPARLERAPANSFGTGCSSSHPVALPGGGVGGEIRWLYVAADASLVAVAGPVHTAALVAVGAIVEAVLRSVTAGGVAERPASDVFDAAELVAAGVADQPRWRA